MRRILAIDPGPETSGFVVWDTDSQTPVVEAGQIDNPLLIHRLRNREFVGAQICAFEMIACYGMAVGASVFETCVWIGRIVERAGIPAYRVYRKDVKMHLCRSMEAKDANIRAALIDKYGAPGTTKAKGKLYGIYKHIWAAVAVADYVACNLEYFGGLPPAAPSRFPK